MNVDVHFFAIAIQKQQREWKAGRRHQVVIGGRERVHQQAVANQPAVDEHENRIPVELLNLRRGDESAQGKNARSGFGGVHNGELALYHVEIDQLIQSLAAEYLVNALAQGLDRRNIQKVVAAVAQVEGFLRMSQAVMRGERSDVRQLGLIRTQKLLARRNIEEKIANRDGGPGGTGEFIAAQQLSAGEFDCRAGGLIGRAGFEQQARDRRDGGQRFAAKAERRDGEQILDVAQFAGGVALKGQQGVVAQHAAAVV